MRRGDQGRAVSYAQNWLLGTQRLSLYFGVTYNVYEIYKQDDSGNWVNIETGCVQDAETRRAKERAPGEQAPGKERVVKQGKVARGKNRAPGDDPRDALFVTDKLPRAAQQWRGRKAKSPLQQRIAEDIAKARQALVEKQAREGK